MSDGFTELLDRAVAFFTELRDNNSKDWFAPRKDRYTADIRKPAALMADLLAEDIGRQTGTVHKAKVFRIYRDVRFSKDKTPLNAHLHLLWSQPEDGRPAWFFGAAPDYLTVGMGRMGMQGEALTRFRGFIDAEGAALAEAIAAAREAAGAEIAHWGPEPLKRVPKPYPADHPQGDLLRRKALALSCPLPADWRETGPVAAINARVAALLPVWRLMDAHA